MDTIRSKVPSKEYKDNYDAIFRKLKYKFNYSDGTFLEKSFSTNEEVERFIANEGDNLVSAEQIG